MRQYRPEVKSQLERFLDRRLALFEGKYFCHSSRLYEGSKNQIQDFTALLAHQAARNLVMITLGSIISYPKKILALSSDILAAMKGS